MVPAPAVTDRSTAKAHLAAFGSPNVCRLYDAWRPIMDEIEDENEKLEFMAKDGQEPSPGELAHLQDALRRQERPARQALADAIASELPHQITATTGNGNTTTASCDNTQ